MDLYDWYYNLFLSLGIPRQEAEGMAKWHIDNFFGTQADDAKDRQEARDGDPYH